MNGSWTSLVVWIVALVLIATQLTTTDWAWPVLLIVLFGPLVLRILKEIL